MAILSDAAARAPGLKFLLVALITIAMSVPLLFVFIALVDRQDYAKTAADDIARGWGGAQVVGGPALAIPYTVSESTRTADDAITTTDVRRIAIFLPKELRGNAVTRTETRSRGIFDVNVYRGEITLDGTFLAPDFGEIGVTPKSIAWDQALLLLPISDLQGLSENVSVLWGAQKTPVPFRPGLVPELAAYSGINARVPMVANTETSFSIAIKLRGTRDLQFTAAGETTEITATGTWPHPSFQGNFLPATRAITSHGFKATWKVPHLARNLPQAMPTPDSFVIGLQTAAFGVSFGLTRE